MTRYSGLSFNYFYSDYDYCPLTTFIQVYDYCPLTSLTSSNFFNFLYE